MIPFNIPRITGNEERYLSEILRQGQINSGGRFTVKCESFLGELSGCERALLTTSCTHALELSAVLLDIQPGDEVVMPSYTYVSSANAFLLRGAKIIFVDICPNQMNIDSSEVERAISTRTKAILVMHYAGVACDMKSIMKIAENHGIYVIEDAAHCLDAYYQTQHLGSIGHLGSLSFHFTKNIHCGEGGALLINDQQLQVRAEILRDKGTNRQAFLNGQVNKYTWVDIGSSYQLSELNAAFLWAQLEQMHETTKRRLQIWKRYAEGLKNCPNIQIMGNSIGHNGHIFYLKCANEDQRNALIQFLKDHEVTAYFHYIPLHDSPYGRLKTVFSGQDRYTTYESRRLLRLPIYFDLSLEQVDYVIELVHQWSKSS